jgi:hypothetical protein
MGWPDLREICYLLGALLPLPLPHIRGGNIVMKEGPLIFSVVLYGSCPPVQLIQRQRLLFPPPILSFLCTEGYMIANTRERWEGLEPNHTTAKSVVFFPLIVLWYSTPPPVPPEGTSIIDVQGLRSSVKIGLRNERRWEVLNSVNCSLLNIHR